MDGGLHWLRPLRLLAGLQDEPDDKDTKTPHDVVRVVGSTSHQGLPTMEGESIAHALLEFGSGAFTPHLDNLLLGSMRFYCWWSAALPLPSSNRNLKLTLLSLCDTGVVGTFRATLLPETHMSAVEPWIRIIGTKGEIVIHASFEGGMTVYDEFWPAGREVDLSTDPELAPGGFQGSFVHQWRDIARVVGREWTRDHSGATWASEESRKGMPQARLALGDIRIAQAIYQSVASGRWEPVETKNRPYTYRPIETDTIMTMGLAFAVLATLTAAAFWTGARHGRGQR